MNDTKCGAPVAPEAEIAKFLRLINQERGDLKAELEVLCQNLQPVLGQRPPGDPEADAHNPAESPIGVELRSHLGGLEYLRRSLIEINQTLAI